MTATLHAIEPNTDEANARRVILQCMQALAFANEEIGADLMAAMVVRAEREERLEAVQAKLSLLVAAILQAQRAAGRAAV